MLTSSTECSKRNDDVRLPSLPLLTEKLAKATEHVECFPSTETSSWLLDNPQATGFDALKFLIRAVDLVEMLKHARGSALAAGSLLGQISGTATSLKRLVNRKTFRLGPPPAEVAKQDVFLLFNAHIELLCSSQQMVRTVDLGHQLLVRTLLDDLALAEQDDVVGLLDGSKAMGDDDGCASLACAIKSGLYDLFATDIDGGSGLVEDEDLGLLDDGTGDGKTLALTATELDTSITYFSLISLTWVSM